MRRTGSGGVVTEGFADTALEVGHLEGFAVRDYARQGDVGGIALGLQTGVDSRVGYDFEETGAEDCCCGVGACESVEMVTQIHGGGVEVLHL